MVSPVDDNDDVTMMMTGIVTMRMIVKVFLFVTILWAVKRSNKQTEINK